MREETSAVADVLDGQELPVVLLVDDEPGVLETWQKFLRAVPCRVSTAGSGEEALRALGRKTVAVLVTDHAMPGMTGIELLERARDLSPETVRVLGTGMVDNYLAEEALNHADAFRFLVKPFDADRLREVVADALEYRQRGLENRAFREEMQTLVAEQGRHLAAANAFLEGVLRALPVGVLVTDAQGKVIRTNAAAVQILGLGEEELAGRTATEVGVPCGAAGRPEASAPTPGCRHRQVDLIHPWGLRRSVLWSCEAVPAGDDGAGGCVASLLDITEEKELEVQVFQAKQEIEAIFDSITDPTFVLDRELCIVRANRALAEMVGRPFQDILGHRCKEVVGPLGRGCDPCGARKVFESGEPSRAELRTPEGTLYSAHFFPMFQRGRVHAVVGRYQDVTAERELEHRLLQSEKMAGIGQLAAGVAHEINNPVGFILSNLNRMAEYTTTLTAFGESAAELRRKVKEGARDPVEAWDAYIRLLKESDLEFVVEDMGDIVAECSEGAGRIRKIVADLKTFSHPDGKSWERADVNAGLESTLNIVWNELKYKCQVVRDYGEIPEILCRPQQLNQVFMNLLVNAAQAIPERGTVTVRTGAEEDRVLVSISDTGTGIPPDKVKRIFDPFFTTKPAGKGTGLGLHIAGDIVRGHGGEIRVQSEVGKGTTFTVALPVTPPASSAQEGKEGG